VTQPRPRAPSTTGPDERTVALTGRIGPDDADGLSDCVCARVAAGERGSLACDVAAIDAPDIGTIDALARMALTARRHGCHVELRRARPELRELLELAGLGGLAVEIPRQDEGADSTEVVDRKDRR
jgi:ABC-type transporter Mla MlaB component